MLAYIVARDGWERLPLFLSYAFLSSLADAQWTPLLMTAYLVPWLGFVFAAKPNIGAALWLGLPTSGARRSAAFGSLALVASSLVVQPGWPAAWHDAITVTSHLRPAILRPGGVLLLLALLRWRRPEARLLLSLASVPSNPGGYEALPLFLVTSTRGETMVLAATTHIANWVGFGLVPRTSPDAQFALTVAAWYLPCLVMVLRRGNEGPAPAWLERAFVRWRVPRWLAGCRSTRIG